MVKLSLIATAAFGLFFSSALAVPTKRSVGTKRVTPTYDQWVANHKGKAPIAGNINYGGGPLMMGQVNIYYIYYGNWPSGQDILENLPQYISSSTYFNIEKTYYQQLSGSSKQYVTGPVVYKGSINDNYSSGKSLADQDVINVITNHLNAGDLPTDTNAVYYLLTSSDVAETSGFCSQYCGYHNNFALNSNTDIKYSFVGDVSGCLSGCAPDNQNVSPNGNPGVDGMISIITHEMMEAISDPDPSSGWTDASGNENADKCAYVYGTENTLSSGAKWNIQVGPLKYLIQENWNANIQGCQIGTGTVTTSVGPTTTPTTTKTSTTSTKTSTTTSKTTTTKTTTTKTTTSKTPTHTPTSCTSGTEQCVSSGNTGDYEVCQNGQWVVSNCGSGSTCYQIGSTPYCF